MSLNCDINPVDSFPTDVTFRNAASDGKENSAFSDVPLTIERKKKPKRVLHFSDGVLEEYSTDDELDNNNVKSVSTNTTMANTKNMTWSVYLWYLTLSLGGKTLSVCDYLGEHLAHFFGITTPKYQYEIDEYQRIIQEEDELRRQEEEESAGWIPSKSNTVMVEQGMPALSLNLSKPILPNQFSASRTSTPLQRF